MSGWGCRYQVGDDCLKLGSSCRPGTRGCVLDGKVVFADSPAPPRKRPLSARPGPHGIEARKPGSSN